MYFKISSAEFICYKIYYMKKLVASLIVLSNLFCCSFADEIGLNNIEKHKVEYTPKVQKETKELTLNKDEALKGIAQLQQQKDIEDIEMLWEATVENNSLIKFAMKKLSIPPEQQRYHSSLLAKSAAALINGASFVPALFGANYMVQSASYATGRLANNYLAKVNNPKEIPLTDTELIELAGMIESLQDQIINSYYSYKLALSQVKDTRQRLVLYNKNYADALQKAKSNDPKDKMEMLVSGTMYDDLLFQEFEQIREVRRYQMDLERLAGKKTVQKLNLYQYAFKNELFGAGLNAKKAPAQNNGGKNDKK